MKLALSTLGCPDWTWEEVFSTVKDLGLDGIEVRGVGREIFAPNIRPFRPAHLEHTIRQLADAGLAVSMLTSAACLGGENVQAAVAEARQYIDLAAKLSTPFVRVMGSINPEPDVELRMDSMADAYSALCEYGAARGVTPLIETNGELADSARMAELLGRVSSENRGVLWDIHHPYRFFGETPAHTLSAIGSEIRYLHVKDSVMADGKVQYRMMGRGDVPVAEAVRLLAGRGFAGYVSLEWVKRWCPDLEEPGVVFYHYADYMKRLLAQLP